MNECTSLSLYIYIYIYNRFPRQYRYKKTQQVNCWISFTDYLFIVVKGFVKLGKKFILIF